MKMINTRECNTCYYGEIEDSDKSKVVVKCKLKNKIYSYGQRIPCEDKRKE